MPRHVARPVSRAPLPSSRTDASTPPASIESVNAPGEASRSGRWWWESNAPKECGIHCAIETGGLEHELHALIGEHEDE